MKKERYCLEGERIRTEKNREYISSLEGLACAMSRGEILEATAMLCDAKLSITCDLGGVRGVIRREEAVLPGADGDVKDIAVITRVGKPICFKVMDITEDEYGRPLAVLSRRAAQEECMREYVMKLEPGDVIPARITHMEHFGAFIDVGCGIISLLSIDAISVSRISHPRDRFEPGERIYAVVKEKDADAGRIYVSHKELLGTWSENASRFVIGTTVSGIVRSVESYGVFVELTPNLAGLAEYSENVEPGMLASVYIKNIIPEKMKLKLVLIDTFSGGAALLPRTYYIDGSKVSHIDEWRYSPECCEKKVESVFVRRSETYRSMN